jgi:hypothetical protein
MNQVHRITIGALLLLPIVAAALLTGFPAQAASTDSARLSDRRITAQIDRSVKDSCRTHLPGSVEHSICVADGRKDAYRAAANARRGERQPTFSYR